MYFVSQMYLLINKLHSVEILFQKGFSYFHIVDLKLSETSGGII
jgi:hypothetical protein